MDTRDAYRQKLEAELEYIHAKLLEYRAMAKVAVADAKIQAMTTLDALDKKYEATKTKLADLNQSGEDAWESVKTGVENAWGELRKAFGEAKERFQK